MGKIYRVLKKIKLSNLVILLLLLIFNTYSWFIYASRVSTGLTASVKSWNVEFVSDTGDVTTNIDINVENIYPGMNPFEKIIDVYNRGETSATLSYEIEYLRIMDEVYEVNEDTGLTSKDLENKIANIYPFKIIIEKDDEILETGGGQGSFKIKIDWPYESENDELDTMWGNRAYEYHKLNPDKKCIEMKIKLIATQQKT